MNQDDLKKRTKLFALRILKLVAALPNTVIGGTIGGQLARAGTSVGSNYRAACRSRSKAEFIAKIGVVEEEADESGFWLEMIIESELVKKSLVDPLLQESIELTKIMASSRKSAKETDSRQMPTYQIGNRQLAIGNHIWPGFVEINPN